jgi:hypothetical protein
MLAVNIEGHSSVVVPLQVVVKAVADCLGACPAYDFSLLNETVLKIINLAAYWNWIVVHFLVQVVEEGFSSIGECVNGSATVARVGGFFGPAIRYGLDESPINDKLVNFQTCNDFLSRPGRAASVKDGHCLGVRPEQLFQIDFHSCNLNLFTERSRKYLRKSKKRLKLAAMKVFLLLQIGVCIGFLIGLAVGNRETGKLEFENQVLRADNREVWAMVQEFRATLAAKGGLEP